MDSTRLISAPKMTSVELQLLTNIDMHSLGSNPEERPRGGICMVSHCYAKANNDPDVLNTYIVYLDARHFQYLGSSGWMIPR